LISFFSYNKSLSFQDSIIFIRFLFIPVIGYFLIFNNDKILNFSIKIIFFTVCFVLIDTLFQYLNYDSQNGFGSDLFGFKSNWYGRLTGPFKDELVPGSFVTKFGFIGFVFLLIQKKNKLFFSLSVIYLAIIGVVGFASGERMALAQYILGMIIFLLFLRNFRMLLFLALILCGVIVFSFYKLHPVYNDYAIIESTHYHQGLIIEKNYKCPKDEDKECKKIINVQPKFIEILKNFKSSAYGEIYNLNIKMFLDNPFTGVGINNYKYVCENFDKYNKEMQNYNCASHPHNFYLQWLAEAGIISFFIFILYLFYIFIFVLKNNKNYNLKIISLTNIIILFWPIMSTGSLIKNWNGVLTFFIIAICISINKIKTNN